MPEAGEDFALAVARALGVSTEAGDEREALLAPLFRMEGPGEANLAPLGTAVDGVSPSASSNCIAKLPTKPSTRNFPTRILLPA